MSDSFYSSINVSVFDKMDDCDREINWELSKYPYKIKVFGLDCEWVTQREGSGVSVCPVALLQLAFPHGKCFLARLCCMDGRIPEAVRRILEDRGCLKVGVGIAEDSKKLSTHYGLFVQGCVDLRHVASRCRAYMQHCFNEDESRHGTSLSSLSQQILGVALDKDWKIRCSNWEAETLSERQIEYAANDAIVAERIFFMLALSKLKEKEERLESSRDGTSSGGMVEYPGGAGMSGGCVDGDGSSGLIRGPCQESTSPPCESTHHSTDVGNISPQKHIRTQTTTLSGAKFSTKKSRMPSVERKPNQEQNESRTKGVEEFSNGGVCIQRIDPDESGLPSQESAMSGVTPVPRNTNNEVETELQLSEMENITSEGVLKPRTSYSESELSNPKSTLTGVERIPSHDKDESHDEIMSQEMKDIVSQRSVWKSKPTHGESECEFLPSNTVNEVKTERQSPESEATLSQKGVFEPMSTLGEPVPGITDDEFHTEIEDLSSDVRVYRKRTALDEAGLLNRKSTMSSVEPECGVDHNESGAENQPVETKKTLSHDHVGRSQVTYSVVELSNQEKIVPVTKPVTKEPNLKALDGIAGRFENESVGYNPVDARCDYTRFEHDEIVQLPKSHERGTYLKQKRVSTASPSDDVNMSGQDETLGYNPDDSTGDPIRFKIANIGQLSESNESEPYVKEVSTTSLGDDVKIMGKSDTQIVDQHDATPPEKIERSGGNLTVISGLFQKLSAFSLGFFTESPSEGSSRAKSPVKNKMYAQYPSFQRLKLTMESLSDSELWDIVIPLIQGIVDVPFKAKQKNRVADTGRTGQTGSHQPGKVKRSSLKPRCAPLYQNCVIEAPDGEMLSTCDRRKADWYLVRDLADVVSQEPYTIRLTFEPAGRPIDPENNYYLTFKENMCVVCGRDDSYMRKNIIPHDYRKHFPPCMKNHHSHDVLLLCPPCHMISCNHDDMLRKRLEKKYCAPLGNQAASQVARLVQDPVLTKVKSAAKALVHGSDKIPAWRRQELLSVVKEFLGHEEPSHERLAETAAMEIRRKNCDFVSHGREVVRKVKEGGELLEFEKMWREHFLATMQPRFLPPLWTVDHEQDKVKDRLEQELQQERENESAI